MSDFVQGEASRVMAEMMDVRVPVPDPTTLTTQQLVRELFLLREIIDTRIEGMEKSIVALQNAGHSIPTIIDDRIKHIHEVINERFASVGRQFQERDVTREQLSTATRELLNAALV